MSKPTFLNSLNSKYILGKELNLLSLELFHLVKAGRLHPLDKDTGRPIPQPHALRIKKRLVEIKQEMKVLPLEKGTIDTLYRGQQKEDAKRKLDLRATALQEEQNTLNEKLKAIIDINDWTTYEPPEEPKNLITHLPIDLTKAFAILQNALFKKSEVEQLNTTDGGQSPTKESVSEMQVESVVEEPTPTATETSVPKESSLDIRAKELLTKKQAEEIIKAMTVIRVSDTEIIIKHGNEEITATCGDMDFKSNAKPWLMFMSILQDRNNQYFIGRYDKVNPDNNKDYLSKAKLFGNFSKKFIEFINYKFSLSLPRSFNVFENLKHLEGDGMYRPKFRVDEHQKSNQQVYLKNLSKDGTLAKLEDLFAKHKCEKDKSAKDHLLNEISKLAAHAKQNNWAMPETIAEAFLGTVTDVTPNLDALEISDYIDEVTKKDRYQL